MADKDFGVKRINLVGAAGTPTITSPTDLIIKANNVAISTNVTVSGSLGIGTTNPTSKIWVNGDGYFAGVITATEFSGKLNATSAITQSVGFATTATNLAGGNTGNIPYQSATNTTAFVTNGDPGQVLISNGNDTPQWGNVSAASGSFGGITIKDEGNLVGTSNSITTLNFVSSNLTVTATTGSNGIATITMSDTLVGTGLSISGISTLGTVKISSGIVTSTTGAAVTFYGNFVGTASSAGYATTAFNLDATAASNLNVAYASTAGYATTAFNLNGVVAGDLNVAYASTAGYATTAFNLNGVVESNLNVAYASTAGIASAVKPNSVGLGTDTFGDYVKSISGISNEIQITVLGGTGESSTPTVGFAPNPTIGGNVTIGNDLQVNNNLNVTGNITIGGTTGYILVENFRVSDADIILGFTTNISGQDISNDTTANHGGIAIASTEGNPLVSLNIVGIETLPATYKKIMWFKAGAFAGLNTDAWLSNYAIGIGSTQFPVGTRLAAGNVQFTQNDLAVVRNINATGIVTADEFSGKLNATSALAQSVGFATTASNLADGTAGSLPYQNSSGITSFISGGTNNQVLLYDTGTNKPYWGNVSSGEGSFAGITVRDEGTTSFSNIVTVDIFGSNITATSGGTGIASIRVNDNLVGTALSISGISTLGTVSISSGIVSSTTGTAVTFIGNLTGTASYATTAGIATNLKGGSAGNIPYQSSTDTTAFVTNGTPGQVLISNGSDTPYWSNVSSASGSFGGITVRDEGDLVGTASSITTLNFVSSNLVVTAITGSNGIATITMSDNIVGTALSISGISTSSEFVGGGSNLRNLSGTHLVSYASASDISNSALSIAGISTYIQVGILTGSLAVDASDGLGQIVAVSADGKTIIASGQTDEIGATTSTGIVYVFDRVGNSFNQVGILTGSYAVDANDNFGISLASSADGKTIIVGASSDEIGATTSTGIVYVFDRVGNSFNQVGILTGSYAGDASDGFGQAAVATSADGKTIIVGAQSDEIGATLSTGIVYVFDRIGNSFNQVGILTGSLSVDASDGFGQAVATSADGKTIVVGAIRDEIGATTSTGIVYVFDRVGNSFNQVGILTGSYAVDANDSLGQMVAVSADGKTIIASGQSDEIGAITTTGIVYVFDRVGNSFNQVGILTGSYAVDNFDVFGYSIATSADGKTIVVGARSDEIDITNAGIVYVFKRQGNLYNQVGILTGSLAGTNDSFGQYVAISADGKNIIVGAYSDEIGATSATGIVYVFDEVRDTYVYSGPTGNIGIGSTNPTSKLWVNGDGYFIGSVTSANGFYVNGELVGQGGITGENIVGTSLSISGISTLSTVKISSGIVTATTGIVTFYGDFVGTASSAGYATTAFNLDATALSTLNVAYASTAGIATYTSEWILGANGISDYTFTGPGFIAATNDPILYLIRGQQYKFTNTMGAHPFRIQSTVNGSPGTQYNIGIVNNDVSNGTLTWDVQFDSPSILYYQCTAHGSMGGKIYIIDAGIGSDISINTTGIITANSFRGDGSQLSGLIAGVSISTNTTNQAQYLTYVTETGSTTGFGVTTTGLVFNPSSNSLGIGTTNPTSKLTVQGDVLISGITTSGITRISSSTASPNITRPVATIAAVGASTDYDIAIVPKGNGAIVANIPDGTSVGGNKRGTYAVDLQLSRSTATHVASGENSFIGNGHRNTASSNYSAVLSGSVNTSSSLYSVISGGNYNTASGEKSFIGNGEGHTASGNFSSIVNGEGNNTRTSDHSIIASGSFNDTYSSHTSILCASYSITRKNYSSVISGYWGDTRNTYGAVVFSGANSSFGSGVTAGGGYQQSRLVILSKATTDATPSTLTANGNAYDGDNVLDIPTLTAYLVKGSVIAYAYLAGTGDSRAWEFTTVIKRQYGSSTSLVGTPIINDIAYDSGASGWNLSITADASTNSLKVEVTGQESTTIRWVTKIDSTEVKF